MSVPDPITVLPDINGNLSTYSLSTLGVGVIIRLVYIWWMKGKPGVEQASANSDLYKLLREELNLMKKELRLVKRQLTCLEMLSAQAGIDIQAEYAKRGLLDPEDEDEAKTHKK